MFAMLDDEDARNLRAAWGSSTPDLEKVGEAAVGAFHSVCCPSDQSDVAPLVEEIRGLVRAHASDRTPDGFLAAFEDFLKDHNKNRSRFCLK